MLVRLDTSTVKLFAAITLRLHTSTNEMLFKLADELAGRDRLKFPNKLVKLSEAPGIRSRTSVALFAHNALKLTAEVLSGVTQNPGGTAMPNAPSNAAASTVPLDGNPPIAEESEEFKADASADELRDESLPPKS